MATAEPANQPKTQTLSDTALVILNLAGQRKSKLVLPLPDSLKAPAHQVEKTLKSLVTRAYVEECPAKLEDVIWRTDEQERHLTLRISAMGESAINGDSPGNREDDAPEVKRGAQRTQPQKHSKKLIPTTRKADRSKTRKAIGTRQNQDTKAAKIVALLQRANGATIAELVKSTGWQPHSVRGFLSGTIKKKLGFKITSERPDGKARRYRLAGKA